MQDSQNIQQIVVLGHEKVYETPSGQSSADVPGAVCLHHHLHHNLASSLGTATGSLRQKIVQCSRLRYA